MADKPTTPPLKTTWEFTKEYALGDIVFCQLPPAKAGGLQFQERGEIAMGEWTAIRLLTEPSKAIFLLALRSAFKEKLH